MYYSLLDETRVLVLSDPFFPLMRNNCGKSVFAMWRIKIALEEGYALLTQQHHSNAGGKNDTHVSQTSIDDQMVNTNKAQSYAPTPLSRLIQKMIPHKKLTLTDRSHSLTQQPAANDASINRGTPAAINVNGAASLTSTPLVSPAVHSTVLGLTHILLPPQAQHQS